MNMEDVADEAAVNHVILSVSKYQINTFYNASLSSINSSFCESPKGPFNRGVEPKSKQNLNMEEEKKERETDSVVYEEDMINNNENINEHITKSRVVEVNTMMLADELNDSEDDGPGLSSKMQMYSSTSKQSYIAGNKSFPKRK